MSETITTYRTQVSGFWVSRHVFFEGAERLGVLSMHRNRLGMVVSGKWSPEQGEVFHFRREPGLLRPQFSGWTETPEWLVSSDRNSLFRRRFELWTGGKPYRLVPLPGFRRGWRLIASRTGECLRLEHGLFRRGARISVYRKTELELVLFAYFLGAMALFQSLLPTSLDDLHEADQEAARAPQG